MTGSVGGGQNRHARVGTWITRLHIPSFVKGKVHPCTGTEALYTPYGP